MGKVGFNIIKGITGINDILFVPKKDRQIYISLNSILLDNYLYDNGKSKYKIDKVHFMFIRFGNMTSTIYDNCRVRRKYIKAIRR